MGFLKSWFTKDVIVCAIAEFIATFLFVYLVCGSVVVSATVYGKGGLDNSRLLVVAIAHGAAIIGLVSATAGISGGHLNPAITVGMMVIRQIPIFKGLMYIFAQFVGAVLGAGLLKGAVPEDLRGTLGVHSLSPKLKYRDGVIFEIIFAFTVMFVFMGSAMNEKRGMGNVAPLAIGFTVMLDHLVGVPLTGASMNPARSFGPAVWTNEWRGFWLYVVGPFTGMTAAAVIYYSAFMLTDSDNDVHSVATSPRQEPLDEGTVRRDGVSARKNSPERREGAGVDLV